MLALITLALLTPQTSEAPGVIAITASGKRVEALRCEIGAIQIETPFGRFITATDPVAEIRPLAQNLSRLHSLKQQGVFSTSEWLTALSEGGFLSALIEESEIASVAYPEIFVGHNLIEKWSESIEALPPNIDIEHQVDWLYKRFRQQNGLKRILSGNELVRAISPATNRRAERNLTHSQLSDELSSTDAVRRYIGVMACRKQSEINLLRPVLAMSITDHSAHVRNTAANAASQLHQHASRQYWVRLAARAPGPYRSYAVDYLAELAGPIGIEALQLIASASGRLIGEKYSFRRFKVSIVKDYDHSIVRPVMWLEFNTPDVAESRRLSDLNDNSEFLYSRSTILVTKVPSLLAEQIQAHL
ncbi:MAG: hypothetical protein QGF46_05455 [Planctomycetota bacterium]|jgi:hypothetical protein|nr:hypothetical protein [Planctomycetota bacterium]